MSDKYIIKNCPCFFEENKEVNDYTCSWCGTEELACQDCTDCVLKQIVGLCEKCKKDFHTTKREVLFASKILELLDIEEVE